MGFVSLCIHDTDAKVRLFRRLYKCANRPFVPECAIAVSERQKMLLVWKHKRRRYRAAWEKDDGRCLEMSQKKRNFADVTR